MRRKPCAICGTASYEQKIRPAGALAPDGGEPSAAGDRQDPRRHGDARNDARARPLRVGQRVPGTSRGCARLRNRRLQRHQPGFHGIPRRGGLREPRALGRGRLGMALGRRRRAPGLLGMGTGE
jgi:hypothetical protein